MRRTGTVDAITRAERERFDWVGTVSAQALTRIGVADNNLAAAGVANLCDVLPRLRKLRQLNVAGMVQLSKFSR